MFHILLVLSIALNAAFFYRITDDTFYPTSECEAYEDFLEQWYLYDQERQKLLEEGKEIPEFEYDYPEEEYDGPVEEIKSFLPGYSLGAIVKM